MAIDDISGIADDLVPDSETTGKQTTTMGFDPRITDRNKIGKFFSKIPGALMDGGKPTALGTGLAVGLPAILAGIGAAADAKKAQPMDPANT